MSMGLRLPASNQHARSLSVVSTVTMRRSAVPRSGHAVVRLHDDRGGNTGERSCCVLPASASLSMCQALASREHVRLDTSKTCSNAAQCNRAGAGRARWLQLCCSGTLC